MVACNRDGGSDLWATFPEWAQQPSLPSLEKDLVETTLSNSCYSRWIYGFFYFLPHKLLYRYHYERPVKTECLLLFATPLAALKRNYRLLSGPSCPSNIIGTPLSGFKRFSSYKWSNFGQELCYYIIYIFFFLNFQNMFLTVIQIFSKWIYYTWWDNKSVWQMRTLHNEGLPE